MTSKLLPMAMPLVKKAAAPLATGALSGLASLSIDKLFGKGQTGGFMIPNSKVNQLIQYKDMLTTKQKQDKGKVTLFNVSSSFSYEAGINGSRRCALYPPPSVSAPSYGYLKL